MVDAVNSLLNNAVDFYVQAIDYCRISTSQIPTPVGARIRQIKLESGDIQQMSPDSGRSCWIRPERRRSGILAGILDGSGRSGLISSRLAGIMAGEAGSGQNAGSPAIWPGYWMDPAVLAGPGFGQNGRTPGIWPDPAVLAESPASWP
jgi:hypothetical protein